MKKIAALCSMFIAGAVFGQTPAPRSQPVKGPVPVPTSVAVMNFNLAVLETASGQTATNTMLKNHEPQQRTLDQLARELQALQKQGHTYPVDEVQNARLTAEKQAEYDAAASSLRSAYLAETKASTQPIATDLAAFVRQYAKIHRYAIIFVSNDDPSNPVLAIGDDRIDITHDVVTAYVREVEHKNVGYMTDRPTVVSNRK